MEKVKKNKKILTKEQIDALETQLQSYGEIDEDWVLYRGINIRGVEKAYAFKRPPRLVFEDFKRKLQNIQFGTKKGQALDPSRIDFELLIDCLIHPTREEFMVDYEARPNIVGGLSMALMEFADEGIEVKKA